MFGGAGQGEAKRVASSVMVRAKLWDERGSRQCREGAMTRPRLPERCREGAGIAHSG